MAQLEAVPAAEGNRGALLLVDDNSSHREVYSRRLERHGYRVRTASSADEAIAALRLGTPDAVVLDIAMPGRDGLSALEECVAVVPTVPIILHSAYPVCSHDYMAWLADDYVQKSLNLEPLLAALERTLQKERGPTIAKASVAVAG